MRSSAYQNEKYDNIPYDKNRVWEREILDNSYVFDIAEGGVFIARRAVSSRRDIGKSVYDIMSREGAEEMIAHLMSHTDVLMFVKTVLGPAIVVPSLVPSCSLGVLVFDTQDTEDVFRAARVNKMRAAYSRELIAGRCIRNTKSSLKNAERSALLISRLYEVFAGTHTDQLVSGDITSLLEERIYALSYYVGCPVSVVCDRPIVSVGDLDFSLFVVFVLISLMCARDISPLRDATVTIENNDYGLSVRINIVSEKQSKEKITPIESFRALAYRKRMLFECHWETEGIHTRFSPLSKDWSLLEVKSPDDET